MTHFESEHVTHFEHERRYLVAKPPELTGHLPTVINQAYVFIRDGYCVRIRRSTRVGDSRATTESWDSVAVKGPRYDTTRAEEEWPLAQPLAMGLFRLADWKVVKSRYQLVYRDYTWELDQFHHANEGLYIAECETEDPAARPVPPVWCTKDITGDNRYDNEQLAMNPWPTWPENRPPLSEAG